MFRRQCIVVDLRSAIALIVIFILGGIQRSLSDTKASEAVGQLKENSLNNYNTNNDAGPLTIVKNPNDTSFVCNGGNNEPSDVNLYGLNCSDITFPCIRCNYNYSCIYGRDLNVTCTVLESVQCQGERTFQKEMNCRYCYQTELWQQSCVLRGNCNAVNDQYYRTNCTVHTEVLCLGNRSFTRNVRCNWTQGYRWSTALIISILLGGFGADRFYLGHWQEGIGKLFSFGGLGVWTIIDVLLISLHYLGPADGSLYI